MKRPLLLLDVDGVINVFRPGLQDGPAWAAVGGLDLAFQVQGHWLRVPRGMKERLKRLDEAFECVWATSWEGDAATVVGARLGIGRHWPFIRFLSSRGTGRRKLAAISDWCDEHAQGRPLAWVDDDIDPSAWDWARNRGDTLLVPTRLDEGLTEHQADELLRWADALAGESGYTGARPGS